MNYDRIMLELQNKVKILNLNLILKRFSDFDNLKKKLQDKIEKLQFSFFIMYKKLNCDKVIVYIL